MPTSSSSDVSYDRSSMAVERYVHINYSKLILQVTSLSDNIIFKFVVYTSIVMHTYKTC